MRGQAHQVDGQGRHINVHAAGGLCRIDMKNNALFPANSPDGGNVLDHADLVIHKHDAGQNGVRANRGFESVQVDQAVGLHIEVGDLKTLALELAAGVEHGFVLGLDRDQVLAFGFVELRRALDRQVVGFGGARGPDDFTRVGPNQVRNMSARGLDRRLRLPAPGVAA